MARSAFVDRIERLIFVCGVFFAIICVRNPSCFCANHEKMVLDFYYMVMALQNPPARGAHDPLSKWVLGFGT